jgi:hypothetical protein
VLSRFSPEELRARLVEAFSVVLGVRFDPAPWEAADEAAVSERLAGYAPLLIEEAAPPSAGSDARPAARE